MFVRTFKLRRFAPVICLLCSVPALAAADEHRVRLEPHDQTIDVTIDGQLFTTYHFADDFIRPYVRPFFWPVNAPDGTPLTADQAQTFPAHPHQRSIWIGHGDVNGADHWKITHKPTQPKQRHIDLKDITGDGFTEDLIWEDKDGEPMLGETRSFRFSVYPDGARAIDLRMRFTPISGGVTFGMARDHGLLAVRMVPAIADHPQLVNSTGASTPDAISDKRADWCDESGQIDGKTYGVAIFDAADNIHHPPYWHANVSTHLGPDIVGPGKANKPSTKPDVGPLLLPAGQTLTLSYRIVFHQGDALSAEMSGKYKAFAAGK
jgi:hypothetical protein